MKETLVCYPHSLISSYGIWNGDNPMRYSMPLLILQMVLVFVSTRTVYFILKPLKQPRVVSEIIGGIILGPSVLGRSQTYTKIVFPEPGMAMLNTLAMFGLMYVIFLIGVKMDPALIKKTGRKAMVIGFVGLFLPYIIIISTSILLDQFLAKEIRNGIFLAFLAAVLSISSFAVLVPILSELNLLNSEVGRLAISSSMTNDVSGWTFMIVFIIIQASWVSPVNSLWAFLSLIALIVFIVCVVRPLALWIVQRTPEGKPVDDVYIFTILLGVSVIGFFSDIIGANSFNGALVLGLAIPDGPPLGAALVDKLDCIANGLLLPLYYAMSGLRTNVFAIDDLSSFGVLQLIVLIGCFAKMVGILLPSLYYKMTFRDALSLSILMNSKGLVEVVTYNFWLQTKLLDDQSFTILVLSTVAVAGIVTPIVRTIYQPSRRYIVYKRRTIQHLKSDSELRMLICIHNEDNIPNMINLLEASNATKKSPIWVYALHLVRLTGRAAPLLTSHKISQTTSTANRPTQSERIVNALRIYENQKKDIVYVHPFTCVAPYVTMHDEICHVSLERRVSLIIIPFHKKALVDGTMETNNPMKTMNLNVLNHAPCSVGVLADRSLGVNTSTILGPFSHNIALLFFGGDDDREALSYTARMTKNPRVNVTIVHFLPNDCGEDNMKEKKLDNEVMSKYKFKNANNERVTHREAMVKDMEEIVGVIRSMDLNSFDLWIVGMRHADSLLNDGFRDWSDCPELGIIGDMLAAPDFGGRGSILVLRQQFQASLQLPRDASGPNIMNIQTDSNVHNILNIPSVPLSEVLHTPPSELPETKIEIETEKDQK